MSKAKNCIISCIDFRIQKDLYNWMAQQGYLGNSDLVFIAGSTRDIVKPQTPEHRKNVLRQLEISVKLHNPDNIILIDHQDCGGYAQDGTIAHGLSVEEDQKEHQKYMQSAKGMLKELYPDKNIVLKYINLQGQVY